MSSTVKDFVETKVGNIKKLSPSLYEVKKPQAFEYSKTKINVEIDNIDNEEPKLADFVTKLLDSKSEEEKAKIEADGSISVIQYEKVPKQMKAYLKEKTRYAKHRSNMVAYLMAWEDADLKLDDATPKDYYDFLDEKDAEVLDLDALSMENAKSAKVKTKSIVKALKSKEKALIKLLSDVEAANGVELTVKVTFIELEIYHILRDRINKAGKQYINLEDFSCKLVGEGDLTPEIYQVVLGDPTLSAMVQEQVSDIIKTHMDTLVEKINDYELEFLTVENTIINRYGTAEEASKNAKNLKRYTANMKHLEELQQKASLSIDAEILQLKEVLSEQVTKVVVDVVHNWLAKKAAYKKQKKTLGIRISVNGLNSFFTATTAGYAIIAAIASSAFPPLAIVSLCLAVWSLGTNLVQVYEFHRLRHRSIAGLLGPVRERYKEYKEKYGEKLRKYQELNKKAGVLSDESLKEYRMVIYKALTGSKWRSGLSALNDDIAALLRRLAEHEDEAHHFSRLIVEQIKSIELLEQGRKEVIKALQDNDETMGGYKMTPAQFKDIEDKAEVKIAEAEKHLQDLFTNYDHVIAFLNKTREEVIGYSKSVSAMRAFLTHKDLADGLDGTLKLTKLLAVTAVSVTDAVTTIHGASQATTILESTMVTLGGVRRFGVEMAKEYNKRKGKAQDDSIKK